MVKPLKLKLIEEYDWKQSKVYRYGKNGILGYGVVLVLITIFKYEWLTEFRDLIQTASLIAIAMYFLVGVFEGNVYTRLGYITINDKHIEVNSIDGDRVIALSPDENIVVYRYERGSWTIKLTAEVLKVRMHRQDLDRLEKLWQGHNLDLKRPFFL